MMSLICVLIYAELIAVGAYIGSKLDSEKEDS